MLLQIDHQHSVPHSSAVLPDGPCHAATAAQQWISSSQVRLSQGVWGILSKLHILTFHVCNTSGRCFQCFHGKGEETDSTWIDLHNQAYQIYSQPDIITVRVRSGRHTEYTTTPSKPSNPTYILNPIPDFVSFSSVSLCQCHGWHILLAAL